MGVRFSDNLTNKEWENTYQEIEELSNYYQFTYENNVIVDKLKFVFAKTKKDIAQVKNRFDWLRSDRILIIEFSIDTKTLTDNNLILKFFIEKRLRDLIVGISIAKKGGIDYGQNPILFIDGKVYSSLASSIHSIGYGVEHAAKIKWPKIRMLDLRTTLTWLNKYQSQMDSLSSDKIGRAINAYSNLFTDIGDNSYSSTLFWTMLGLEALFSAGSDNVLNQVNLKSQVLLGKRKEFKKSFSEMYGYRSKFVHGALDINNKMVLHDRGERVNTHWINYYENEHLAIAIIIATFQKLIMKNLTELDFDLEYKIRATKK